jgi:hypothetical protein
VAKHFDSRGDVFQLMVRDNVSINAYFTKAGYLRSGDIHKCDQHNVVLKGRIRRTVKVSTSPHFSS